MVDNAFPRLSLTFLACTPISAMNPFLLTSHFICKEAFGIVHELTGSKSRSKLSATCLESSDTLGEASTRQTETASVQWRPTIMSQQEEEGEASYAPWIAGRERRGREERETSRSPSEIPWGSTYNFHSPSVIHVQSGMYN